MQDNPVQQLAQLSEVVYPTIPTCFPSENQSDPAQFTTILNLAQPGYEDICTAFLLTVHRICQQDAFQISLVQEDSSSVFLDFDIDGKSENPGSAWTEKHNSGEVPETAKVGIDFSAKENPGNYQLLIQISGDRLTMSGIRIEPEMLQAWSEIFTETLSAIRNGVDNLSGVFPDSHRELFEKVNATETDWPQKATIGDLFYQVAEEFSDEIAVCSANETWKYSDLETRVSQVVAFLNLKDRKSGDSIGVFMDRSPQFIAVYLGILKSGCVCVPLDPEYPAERLKWIVKDCELEWIISDRESASIPISHEGIQFANYNNDIRKTSEVPVVPANINSDSPAITIYTSGSTGRPKGAVIPHRAMIRLVRGTDFFPFENCSFLLASSICFDTSILEIFGPVLNGGKIVVPDDPYLTPAKLQKHIQKDGVNSLWMTSGLFQVMVDESVESFRGLKNVIAGGDVVPRKHTQMFVDAVPGCQLIIGYGPTENTTFTTTHPVTPEDLLKKSLPVGKPIANTTAWIVDQQSRLCPVGVPGELVTGGAGVALEYLNRPDLTEERYTPDRYSGFGPGIVYHTGDLCRFRPDGTIDFLGRIDNQVKIRGFRIEPGEIEIALLRIAEIQAAKVMAIEYGNSKQLAAFLVCSDPPAKDDIISSLKEELPDYMIPSHFRFLDAFPLTKNGKVNRVRLMAGFEEAVPGSSKEVVKTELTATETGILAIWQTLFNKESISPDDDFFELGGDSLMAIRLVAHLQKSNHVDLSAGLVFQYPTPEKLAHYIDQQPRTVQHHGSKTESNLVFLRSTGSKEPLFVVHGGEGGVFFYRSFLDYIDPPRPVCAIESPELSRQGAVQYRSVPDLAREYIEAIIKYQPDGPYHLCGYSYGGLVAYEMACQLRRGGQEVQFLGMIDIQNPCSATIEKRSIGQRVKFNWYHSRNSDRGIFSRTADLLSRFFRGIFYRSRNGLQCGLARLTGEYAHNIAWLRLAKIRELNIKSMKQYCPQVYPGDVTLLKAKVEEDKLDFGDAYGWKGLIKGELNIYEVDGNHVSLVSPRHVKSVATKLAENLEKAQA